MQNQGGISLHSLGFFLVHHAWVEAGAAELTHVRTTGLVAVHRRIRHASQGQVLEIGKVLEGFSEKQGQRVHLNIFRIVVDISRLG
jgi:hypothetical protein